MPVLASERHSARSFQSACLPLRQLPSGGASHIRVIPFISFHLSRLGLLRWTRFCPLTVASRALLETRVLCLIGPVFIATMGPSDSSHGIAPAFPFGYTSATFDQDARIRALDNPRSKDRERSPPVTKESIRSHPDRNHPASLFYSGFHFPPGVSPTDKATNGSLSLRAGRRYSGIPHPASRQSTSLSLHTRVVRMRGFNITLLDVPEPFPI